MPRHRGEDVASSWRNQVLQEGTGIEQEETERTEDCPCAAPRFQVHPPVPVSTGARYDNQSLYLPPATLQPRLTKRDVWPRPCRNAKTMLSSSDLHEVAAGDGDFMQLQRYMKQLGILLGLLIDLNVERLTEGVSHLILPGANSPD